MGERRVAITSTTSTTPRSMRVSVRLCILTLKTLLYNSQKTRFPVACAIKSLQKAATVPQFMIKYASNNKTSIAVK